MGGYVSPDKDQYSISERKGAIVSPSYAPPYTP